ncbi:MAG: TctB citrate transporter, partial [uncultured Blastococcus sp.]
EFCRPRQRPGAGPLRVRSGPVPGGSRPPPDRPGAAPAGEPDRPWTRRPRHRPDRGRHPADGRLRVPRRGRGPGWPWRAGGRRGHRAHRRQRLAHGADAGGGVHRQRPADRAARLALLRRDPLLGGGLRARQPALRPGRRHRARPVLRLLVPVRLRPEHGAAGRHPEGDPL